MESSEESHQQSERNAGITGKRLRVGGPHRTENEYKQMLRLCEIESRELKDSLRYVEIQLAKTKENLRQMTGKYETSREEIQKCHEQIARQANINHAQTQQIDEMSKRLNTVNQQQAEIQDKNNQRIEQYQNELDIREIEINRIKKLMEQKDVENNGLKADIRVKEGIIVDRDEELEMKSGENNRLRKQVADMEKAVQDLYRSRKGNGSLQIELDALKADNDRLIQMLKDTSEYADLTDAEIIKAAQTLNQGGTAKFNQLTRPSGTGPKAKAKPKLNNDWIPTEAVRCIATIRERYNGEMSETCVSQILYDLNMIWRNIMRKENDAIKKKTTAQIQDLRRQVVTKQAFDKGELQQEITNTRRELSFVSKKLQNTRLIPSDSQKENSSMNRDELQITKDLLSAVNDQKRDLEDQNRELRDRIETVENSRLDFAQAAAGAQRANLPIPPLNISHE